MPQINTTRFMYRSAPGQIVTPIGGPRETESCYTPYVVQQLTITIAGADPFAAAADLEIVVPLQDGSGTSVTVELTIANGQTLAQAAASIAAAWNDSQAASLYTASAVGAVVTLIARSHLISVPAAQVVGTFSDAHTATTAQTVAASAPSLVMGRFYQRGTVATPLAIAGTPRDCKPAAALTGSTTIAQIRGMVGREVNSTELAWPNNFATFDAYPAGQPWPGLLRGQGYVQVDPASGTITESSEVHVVIAAGAYSLIGAVASAADGGNTIRIDNAPTGNILASVVSVEEDLRPFGPSLGRYVLLKLNRTN